MKMSMAKLFKAHWKIILIEAILILITLGALSLLQSESEKIHIAVVFNEEKQSEGILNALNIYVERINKYGGVKLKDIHGGTQVKSIEIKPFYDEVVAIPDGLWWQLFLWRVRVEPSVRAFDRAYPLS